MHEQKTDFHGSYAPEDVTFLMKVVDIPDTDVATKERMIQSGQRHYSEMINRETLPSDRYLDVFRDACDLSMGKMAADCAHMAARMAAMSPGRAAVVSLARAGTPVGVAVHRLLRDRLGIDSSHYSVSIIRDRGIDENALDFIRARHDDSEIFFVDGWTGKGVISDELSRFVEDYNQSRGASVDGGLWVLADICGKAAYASTGEDYLIPSAVLNSTVSGLVSRSILNDDVVDTGAGEFHGCVYYREFENDDLSRWFADRLSSTAKEMIDSGRVPERPEKGDPATAVADSAIFMEKMMKEWDVLNRNYVKPGIGEATRVLLRRVPDKLLLKDASDPQVAHLLVLAEEKEVEVAIYPDMPYSACSLIRNLKL